MTTHLNHTDPSSLGWATAATTAQQQQQQSLSQSSSHNRHNKRNSGSNSMYMHLAQPHNNNNSNTITQDSITSFNNSLTNLSNHSTHKERQPPRSGTPPSPIHSIAVAPIHSNANNSSSSNLNFLANSHHLVQSPSIVHVSPQPTRRMMHAVLPQQHHQHQHHQQSPSLGGMMMMTPTSKTKTTTPTRNRVNAHIMGGSAGAAALAIPNLMNAAPTAAAPATSSTRNLTRQHQSMRQQRTVGGAVPAAFSSSNTTSHHQRSSMVSMAPSSRMDALLSAQSQSAHGRVLVPMSPLSNHVKPTHKGKTSSLANFDPLFLNDDLATTAASTTTTATKTKAALQPIQIAMAQSQQQQQQQQPQTKKRISPSHRKGMQTFCVSDLRSISQDAMDKNDADNEENISNISSTIKSSPSSTTPKDGGESLSSGSDHSASKERSSCEATATATTPPKKSSKFSSIKKMMKKGHRRTKSMEAKEVPPSSSTGSAGKQTTATTATSKAATASPNTTMYPTLIKDLMGLKMETKTTTTFAKPMPTSFLTGTQDEVVRTCEIEPALHQIEIPTLDETTQVAKYIEFIENYRNIDQNFHLNDWKHKTMMELSSSAISIPQHQPILDSFKECGIGTTIQGYIRKGQNNLDECLEVCIFEGQRNFTVVFRGTTEQQQQKNFKKSHSGFLPLMDDEQQKDVQVFSSFKEEYTKIETECFALLDKLTEENPFCDIVFAGHSFGAAVATLAAFKYANARPMVRVGCMALASPKVGSVGFRQAVNSSPNLKVMRLEYGQDGKCQAPSHGGVHVGHTLVMHGSIGSSSTVKTSCPIQAYKFDTPKYKKFKTTYPDLRSYVNALEEVARLKLAWAKDFVGTTGKGVVVNNESRLVV
eukprot:CAMPEP_0119547098 /NCGR_PEP_ID=MMETSP1352-20130426/1307_1 /TAXON_ID=265584 /ORGANISM="Stauroneis constricta, Strain CCMP1120" /LENGTH=873 /DNA_ID=CAMNT_0007591943 /DNA_START=65 /DNA_END=2686 /DNA_ORIENTATION=+